MKIKKLFKKFQGFTLVELIVVIAIVSILAVVGGLTVTQFVGDGRDARVKSDVTNIAKALEIHYADTGELPIPDNYISGGVDYLYQGILSGGVEDELDTISYVPEQPNGDKYVYSVTPSGFQVVGILESNNQQVAYRELLGDTAYAAETIGNWFVVSIQAIPLITNENGNIINSETTSSIYNVYDPDGERREDLEGGSLDTVVSNIENELKLDSSADGSADSGEASGYTLSSCPSGSDDGEYTRDEIFNNLDINGASMIGCILEGYGSNTDPNENVYIAGLTTGNNIMIISINDDSTGATWGSMNDVNNLLNITEVTLSDWNGLTNTDSILAEYPDSSNAAKICRAKGDNWYLPAKSELNIIYSGHSAGYLLNFEPNNYWSSTEGGTTSARRQDLTDGHQYATSKDGSPRIRCASRF